MKELIWNHMSIWCHYHCILMYKHQQVQCCSIWMCQGHMTLLIVVDKWLLWLCLIIVWLYDFIHTHLIRYSFCTIVMAWTVWNIIKSIKSHISTWIFPCNWLSILLLFFLLILNVSIIIFMAFFQINHIWYTLRLHRNNEG